MPENKPYRIIVRTVRKYAILTAFILAVLTVSAQDSRESTFLQKLSKDTTVTAPFDNMVWMGLPVFSEFYYYKTQFGILQESMPEYQAKVDSLDALYRQTQLHLDSIVLNSNTIIDQERTSKEQAMIHVIRLDKKVSRLEKAANRYRNIAGATLIGVAVFSNDPTTKLFTGATGTTLVAIPLFRKK